MDIDLGNLPLIMCLDRLKRKKQCRTGGANMYAAERENNKQKLQYNMNQFSEYLTMVKDGSKSFKDVLEELEGIRYQLYLINNSIDELQPPDNLIALHNTVKEACNAYIDGVNEFLKFYRDGNDKHFVDGGLKIQKGTELMNKAADMF